MNKRYPRYPDDADYQTNAPSYYEDLARKQKLLKMLAEKIWEYDERLDERLEDLENILQDYLLQWDERIENLDDEVSHIFVTWLEDGTLEQIINHDVLGNKADKTFVDSEIERLEQKDEDIIIHLDETDKEVADNKKALLYVTPEMFGYDHSNPADEPIQDWLNYARTNNILAKAGNLEINRDFNFRNVALEITGDLNIKTYEIELGGNPNTWQQKTQKINKVKQTHKTKSDLQIVIRGCSNQRIEIGHANGVKFRLNDEDDKIAYSTFVFGVVYYIDIDNDSFNVSGDKLLWFNENELHMTIVYHLKMDGSYWHNNNRFYGGTFEGLINKIEILQGRDNFFYNMRFENVTLEPSIIFGEDTFNNTIYQTYTSSHPSRRVPIENKGYGNKIIIPTYDSSTILIDELATVTNLDFFTKHETTLKVSDGNENLLSNEPIYPIFNTPFLPFKKSYALRVECGGKITGGVRMEYAVFDSNFNEVLLEKPIARMDGVGDVMPNQRVPNNNKATIFEFNMLGLEVPDVKYIKFKVLTSNEKLVTTNIRLTLRDLDTSY